MNAFGYGQKAKKQMEEEKTTQALNQNQTKKLINSNLNNNNINNTTYTNRVASTGKQAQIGIFKPNNPYIKETINLNTTRDVSQDAPNNAGRKMMSNNKEINAMGEYGKNLYEKMQSQFTDFIKDKKGQVKLQGNKRYSGKTGDYFLEAQKNENNNNADNVYFEEDSKDANSFNSGSNNNNNQRSRSIIDFNDKQQSKENNNRSSLPAKARESKLYTQRNSRGINIEEIEIIEHAKPVNSHLNSDLYKNEKGIDRISGFMKDAAILKELNLNEKVVTKTKETIITVNQDLTPLPDIDRKKLKEDSITKQKFEKAERAAVLMRRMEYAMGKNKKIKKVSMHTQDNIRIAKIVRIQRFWRELKKRKKYNSFKVIRIQTIFRGFIFRKKFFENLRKLNQMFLDFLKMEKTIEGSFRKRYFKLFKRYYYMKKIMVKVCFIQKHWRKINRIRRLRSLGAQLQCNLLNFFRRKLFAKLNKKALESLQLEKLKNSISRTEAYKIRNLKLKFFKRLEQIMKRLVYFERVFLTAFPLLRLHNLKFGNYVKSFLNYLKSKRRRELLITDLVRSCDEGRYAKLKAHTIKWNEISKILKIIFEEKLTNKNKAVYLFNYTTLKKQRQSIKRRFDLWRNYNRIYLRNKTRRELIVGSFTQAKDKTRDILLRTFKLKWLNIALKLKYIAEDSAARKSKAAKLLDLLTMRKIKFSLRKRFDLWRNFNKKFLRDKNFRENLLTNLIGNKDKTRSMLLKTLSFFWLNIAFKLKNIADNAAADKLKAIGFLNIFTLRKQVSVLKKKFDHWKKFTSTSLKNKEKREYILKSLTQSKAKNRDIIIRTFMLLWLNLSLKIRRIFEAIASNKAKGLSRLNAYTLSKQNQRLKESFDFWRSQNQIYFKNKLRLGFILKSEIANKEKTENIIYRTFLLKWLNSALKHKQITEDLESRKNRAAKLLANFTAKKQRNSLRRVFWQWFERGEKCKNKFLFFARFLEKHLVSYDSKSKNYLLQQKFFWWKTLYLIDKRLMKFLVFSKAIKKHVDSIAINKHADNFLQNLYTVKIENEKELGLKVMKNFIENYSEANNLKSLKGKFDKWEKIVGSQKQKDVKAKILFVLRSKVNEKDEGFRLKKRLSLWKIQAEKLRIIRFCEGFRRLFYFTSFGLKDVNYTLLEHTSKISQNNLEKDNSDESKVYNEISDKFKKEIQENYMFNRCIGNLNNVKRSDLLDSPNKNINNSDKEKGNSEVIQLKNYENPFSNTNEIQLGHINNLDSIVFSTTTNNISGENCKKINPEFYVFKNQKDFEYSSNLFEGLNKKINSKQNSKDSDSDSNQASKADLIFIPYSKEASIPFNNILFFMPKNPNQKESIFKNDKNEFNSPTKLNSSSELLYGTSPRRNYSVIQKEKGECPKNLNFIFNAYLTILLYLSERQKKRILFKYISFISQDQKAVSNKYFQLWRRKTELIGINEHNLNTYSIIMFKLFKNRYKKLLKRCFENWKTKKDLLNSLIMQNSKAFLHSINITLLKFCMQNYLKKAYEHRFSDNALNKFIKKKYLEYANKLRDAFNLWKIKNLKLEKIGLLRFFSSKLILKRGDHLAKLLLKKHFDIMRSKAAKLKKTEELLNKILLRFKKQNFEFFKFQIYLKSTAGQRLKKIFAYLSEAKAEEAQKKYFMRWLKNVYKDKLNLALVVNLRNRLQNVQRIRSTPSYLLNKYFNLWVDNFSLRWKFNKNLQNRNSAAAKIINLIRYAKWKIKILKTRRTQVLMKRRINRLQEFKYFSQMRCFHKWKRGVQNQILTLSAYKISSFVQTVFFTLKNTAFGKIENLITRMLIKVAKSDFRFLKIINNFCKEYDFFNKQKQVQVIRYLKPSQTNALFTQFNKTFELQNSADKNLNSFYNNNNNTLSSNKSFKKIEISGNRYNNQYSNVFLYNGRPVAKSDYFKYKSSLLGARGKRNNNYQLYKRDMLRNQQIPVIFEEKLNNGNENSKKEKSNFKVLSSDYYNNNRQQNNNNDNNDFDETTDTHLLVTKDNQLLIKKNYLFNSKNHILVKRLGHVLQYFILRKDLILSDMKRKYYFKKWVFSKKDWLHKLIRIQRNVIRFIHLQKALTLRENRALLNYVVRKYFFRKVDNKKFILLHYYRKFMNWILLEAHNRSATKLQFYFRSLHLVALKRSNIAKAYLHGLFKKSCLRKNFVSPLKISKFLLLLKKAQRKFANGVFKKMMLNISRARLLSRKYLDILCATNSQILEQRKNATFKNWRNYNKAIKMQTKRSFGLLKLATAISTKMRLLAQRDQLMVKLMKTFNLKFTWKIKKYFYKWNSENKKFKTKIFLKKMQKLALLKFTDACKGLKILNNFKTLKKKLLKRHCNLKLRICREAGERLRIRKKIQERLALAITDLNFKEKKIKKAFMLAWNRQVQKLKCYLRIVFIQKKFMAYLKKKKLFGLLNFVKCFNFISLRKIIRHKKYALDALAFYANKTALIENLNYLCFAFYLEMKKRFFDNFIDYAETKSAILKIKKLARLKFIKDTLAISERYRHFEKIKYLIEMTMHHKQMASNNFLRILFRGWRFIALAEASIRKKMQFFQDNIKNLHEELVDRMLDRDNVTLPKDLIKKNLTQKPITISNKINVPKFNELVMKRRNLVKNVNKLNQTYSEINEFKNNHNTEYKKVNFSMMQNKYEDFNNMTYQNNEYVRDNNGDDSYLEDKELLQGFGNTNFNNNNNNNNSFYDVNVQSERNNMTNLFNTNRDLNYNNNFNFSNLNPDKQRSNFSKGKNLNSDLNKNNDYNNLENDSDNENIFAKKDGMSCQFVNTFGKNSNLKFNLSNNENSINNHSNINIKDSSKPNSLNTSSTNISKRTPNMINISHSKLNIQKYSRNIKTNDFDLSQIDKISNDSQLNEENIFNHNNFNQNNKNFINLDDSNMDFGRDSTNMSIRSNATYKK